MGILKIDKKPSDSDTHTWADYAELLALVNMDGESTVEGVIDRLFDTPGQGRGEVSEDVEDFNDVDDGGGTHEDIDDEGNEPIASASRRGRARFDAKVRDAFSLAAWRSSAYGPRYPFYLDQSNRSLKLKAELTGENFLYLFLLISANLRFVVKDHKKLTDGFEYVASAVMRDVLPKKAEVHIFGKAATERYKGSAFEKIVELCRDIRANLVASKEDFRSNDNGDSGIDIVGWHSLEDEQGNIFVYFAQCACSRADWPKKQLEASSAMLSNVLSCPVQWTTMMFVPVCFRRIGGAWAAASSIASVVFLDRLRMLRNCVNTEVSVSRAIMDIVEAVKSSEAIV